MNLRLPPAASRCALLALAILYSASTLRGQAPGRQFYVDPVTGNDRATGLAAAVTGSDGPVKTIAKGLKLAQAGDTVHLAKATYRESAVFFNRSGEPGRPITLDGHGATLDGAEPLNPEQWQEIEPGLFRCTDLLRHDDAVIQRWFFLWNGQPNHMGRSSKGLRAPLKMPAELQPGEWTYVKDTATPPVRKNDDQGAFYLKLEPGQKLAEARIAAPVRSAGVQFSGTNQHLVIRNLTATHVYNDGFNLHGKSRECVFENIAAIECGDDGISAHDDCQYRVDGFTSIGNSTGICDTGDSITDYRRVFIRGCLGVDLFFLDTNRHSVTDAVVQSTAHRTLVVTGRENSGAICALRLENAFIQRLGGVGEALVGKSALLDASHITLVGLNFQAIGGEGRLADSVLAGPPPVKLLLRPDVKWTAERNLYDLTSLQLGAAIYTPADFAQYQTASGQDRSSEWKPLVSGTDGLPQIPAGIGAPADLPKQLSPK